MSAPNQLETATLGSAVRFSTGPFASLGGSAVDPDIVTFSFTPPGGSAVVFTYNFGLVGNDGTIVRDSVGNYHADVDTTPYSAGVWKYSWQGAHGTGLTETDTITACSGNGTTVTYTVNNTFVAGQTVTISGITGGTGGLGYG